MNSSLETEITPRYHSNCALRHLIGLSQALCTNAAYSGNAYFLCGCFWPGLCCSSSEYRGAPSSLRLVPPQKQLAKGRLLLAGTVLRLLGVLRVRRRRCALFRLKSSPQMGGCFWPALCCGKTCQRVRVSGSEGIGQWGKRCVGSHPAELVPFRNTFRFPPTL